MWVDGEECLVLVRFVFTVILLFHSGEVGWYGQRSAFQLDHKESKVSNFQVCFVVFRGPPSCAFNSTAQETKNGYTGSLSRHQRGFIMDLVQHIVENKLGQHPPLLIVDERLVEAGHSADQAL